MTVAASARPRLEALGRQADAIILSRQDERTGLLPASTAVTVHGDYTHAWVRDNVYSILGVWALSLAWRRVDVPEAERLAARVTQLMRGLLAAMMRQAHKVERFKHTLDPLDALHAKYATCSGEPVVGDGDWGHLQIDATAIFLLELAQLSHAGLALVGSDEEEAFVQNLVHYLARAWRTPDYGIWERGHKSNEGHAELNASSLGMARAALEAVAGQTLRPGGRPIVVAGDDIACAGQLLQALLPRESASKETDAALLAIVGFPAFAVDDAATGARTRADIVAKLQGRYGCKRFLRDGHQTALEDHQRLHYEPGELCRFEGIESEWPLFFTYLLIDAVHRGDSAGVADYRARLEALMQERDGQRLLPELYRVPAGAIEGERASPHSQAREPNDNVPLVWAQSLYLVGVLLQEGLVSPAELSPLRWPAPPPGGRPVEVQLLVLAGDALAQARLAAQGLVVPTLAQAAPLQVVAAGALLSALGQVGRCDTLGLGGRPAHPLGSLMRSRIYRVDGAAGGAPDSAPDSTDAAARAESALWVTLPAFLEAGGAYRALDNRLLVAEIEAERVHLCRHAHREPGQPLLVLPIHTGRLDAPGADVLLAFLSEVARGAVAGCGWSDPAAACAAQPLVRLPAPEPGGPAPAGTGWPEAFGAEAGDATADRDAWEPWEPWDEAATRPLTAQRAAALERERDPAVLLRLLGRSRNPYEQVEILGLLWSRHGEQLPTDRVGGLRAGLDALYRRACQLRLWGVLRRAAGWLERPEPGLEAAVTQILVQHKRLALGRAYSEGAILSAPTTQAGILARVQAYGGADVRARVLIQEVVQLLALLMKAEPGLFRGTLTLRPWSFVILLNGWLAREHGVSQAEAFDHLLDLSPHALLVRLREVIRREQDMATDLLRLHHLDVAAGGEAMQTVSYSPASDPPLADDEGGWQAWRETTGAITRVPAWFHARVWELLRHCNGLVIADQFDLRNRLDSKLLRADMTRAEIGFALQVDDLLHKITAPEYRQLTIEAVTVLADLAAANPALQVDGLFVVDVVIGTAVRLGWQAARRESERDAPEGREGPSVQAYREHIAEAWQAFYASPPHRVANHLVAAARLLLSPGTALPAADTARSMPA